MAIFSRRTIQRLINENAEFVCKSQAREQVKKLNSSNEDSLGAEWEVTVLNSFRKLGLVDHEPKMKGNSRPDIFFTSTSDPTQTFVADIITISDKGLEAQNPILLLDNELRKIARERGLKPNSLQLHVEGHRSESSRPAAKVILKIPSSIKRFYKVVFDGKFSRFLIEVAKTPHEPREYVVKVKNECDLLIIYNPNQNVSITSYPSYNEITSLTMNTIYQSLEGKVSQLISTKYDGPLGVILCDGSCSQLSIQHSLGKYTAADVIGKFLYDYPRISFVLTISIEENSGRIGAVCNPYAGCSFDKLSKDLQESLANVENVLPQAERSAANALNLLKSGRHNEGDGSYGGCEVGYGKIRISARALLDLLAGRIEEEDFHILNPLIRNYCELMLQEHRLIIITGSRIERSLEEHDDDWFIMEFGNPDPAISPYQLPSPYPSRRKRNYRSLHM